MMEFICCLFSYFSIMIWNYRQRYVFISFYGWDVVIYCVVERYIVDLEREDFLKFVNGFFASLVKIFMLQKWKS